MDSFYQTVLLVAVILLILALVGLGILLQNQDSGKVFPPNQSTCPDGWGVSVSVSGELFCTMDISGKNNGDLSFNELITTDYSNNYIEKTVQKITNKVDIKFKPEVLVCDKRKWANTHGVIWDGVSNYNQC